MWNWGLVQWPPPGQPGSLQLPMLANGPKVSPQTPVLEAGSPCGSEGLVKAVKVSRAWRAMDAFLPGMRISWGCVPGFLSHSASSLTQVFSLQWHRRIMMQQQDPLSPGLCRGSHKCEPINLFSLRITSFRYFLIATPQMTKSQGVLHGSAAAPSASLSLHMGLIWSMLEASLLPQNQENPNEGWGSLPEALACPQGLCQALTEVEYGVLGCNTGCLSVPSQGWPPGALAASLGTP